MKKKTRSMTVESLENRSLMAGNVLVDLRANEVVVTGDNQNNAITITEVANNRYRIEGLTVGGSKTTVNNKAFIEINSPDDDLRIYMNGGNDQVLLGNQKGAAMTVEDLTVEMGAGSDQLWLGELEVYDKYDACKLNLGNDSENQIDQVGTYAQLGWLGSKTTATFRASVEIRTGGGADVVTLNKTQVTKQLKIDAGAGTDKVELSNCNADEVYVLLGAGDNDVLSVGGSKARKFTADGGAGKGNKLTLNAGNSFGNSFKYNF